MNAQPATRRRIDRRSLVRGAAWSVPVIAAAVAAPAAAASTPTTSASATTDLGAFGLYGDCGTPSDPRRGFLLSPGPSESLPIGTTILINARGVNNAGTFSVSGGSATVTGSGTQRSITLTAPLPVGATLVARTNLSALALYTLAASVPIPAGYTATGAKTQGTVDSTTVICSDT